MTPTRRDLYQQMVQLIALTQELLRATEESNRTSQRLREDMARLARRSQPRVTPRRSRAVPIRERDASGGDPLRLLQCGAVEPPAGPPRARRVARQAAARAPLTALPLPPSR